jgi:hypothetical protein
LGDGIMAAWKRSEVRNPGGLAVGVWPNYRLQAKVVERFGPRAYERGIFNSWHAMEREQGRYEFAGAFDNLRLAHRNGSAVLVSLNMATSREVTSSGKHQIPAFYPPRITNPATRAAALAFLRAYVRELLGAVGQVDLALEYELIWNYNPVTREIRNEYRDWFVEASAAAREVAKSMGQAADLRIAVVVNGNPLMGNNAKKFYGSPAKNHAPQKWLLDVVAASDVFGIDSYAHDPKDRTQGAEFMRVVRFFTTHYASEKPVYILENGCTSIFTPYPDADLGHNRYHARGTEEEQAEYLAHATSGLATALRADSALRRQIRVYSWWQFRDAEGRPGEVDKEHHFGLTRVDGSEKPAAEAFAEFAREIEQDPLLRTWVHREERDILDDVIAERPVETVVDAEGSRDWLRLAVGASLKERRLNILLGRPGDIVYRLPDGHWHTTARHATQPAVRHVLRVPPCGKGAIIEIMLTAPVFPARQTLRALSLH